MSKSLGLTESTLAGSNLLGGDHPTVTLPITLVSGQNLTAGTVLGRITATGKFTAYDNTAVDGSGTAVCILGEDCDASGGDEKTFAYWHGEFLESALTGWDANAALDLEKAIWAK
ncbi:MAG: head decoration protein [Ignavibacteriae bacterium]|nr:head decoration protein [Ignavibacteriota bacterium]